MIIILVQVLGGTLLGRSFCGVGTAPTRVHGWPRPIPPKKWYFSPVAMIAATGILPFGSIFIEMYFIFTSFWNYKFYYVYGFMLLVLIILSIVSVCITIVTTYFLLNSEDYRWQWVSFLSSGSTAFYVFLYSVYYFFAKTNMSGLMQTTYYFGYMGLFCFAMCVVSLCVCVSLSLSFSFSFSLSISVCVSLCDFARSCDFSSPCFVSSHTGGLCAVRLVGQVPTFSCVASSGM